MMSFHSLLGDDEVCFCHSSSDVKPPLQESIRARKKKVRSTSYSQRMELQLFSEKALGAVLPEKARQCYSGYSSGDCIGFVTALPIAGLWTLPRTAFHFPLSFTIHVIFYSKNQTHAGSKKQRSLAPSALSLRMSTAVVSPLSLMMPQMRRCSVPPWPQRNCTQSCCIPTVPRASLTSVLDKVN